MGQSAQEVRREIERTRDDLGETVDAIGEKVSPRQAVRRRADRLQVTVKSLRERVMGSAGDAGSSVSSGASSMASSVQDTASGMASSIGEAASEAAEAVRNAPETVKAQTQGNPLAVGVIAFGLGALAGTLLPKTQTEQQLAPPLRENVIEPVKETATEAAPQAEGLL
jgi:hypothetical protein